jgi:hypothetical protein
VDDGGGEHEAEGERGHGQGPGSVVLNAGKNQHDVRDQDAAGSSASLRLPGLG